MARLQSDISANVTASEILMAADAAWLIVPFAVPEGARPWKESRDFAVLQFSSTSVHFPLQEEQFKLWES